MAVGTVTSPLGVVMTAGFVQSLICPSAKQNRYEKILPVCSGFLFLSKCV